MKVSNCDILIVGAGPAGSSAALTAAKEGLRVVVAERRRQVGIPVRCAEYIPAPLLGTIKLGKQFVVQPVRGIKTLLPSGEVKETRAPGFTINRDSFDQTLARAAEENGARILLGTRAVAHENGAVVLKENDASFVKVSARMVIGADGPHSTVGRWIASENRNLIPAVQVRVPLVRPMGFAEIYFEEEIYGGYGWVFPKGDEANVGIGIQQNGPAPEPLWKVLERFVMRLAEKGMVEPALIKRFGGWIPAGPPREVTKGKVLLAGDAAGHTHAITGAGIHQAVTCGQMAGKWAARAVKKEDIGLVAGYEEEWRDLFAPTLDRAWKRRQLLEKEWHRLEEVIKHCWVAYREYYAGIE